MQIKLTQQRVLSLTGSQNTTIRENPRTLEQVKRSVQDYAKLLKTGSSLLARQTRLIKHLTRDKPWWEDVKGGQNPFKNVKEMLDSQGWLENLRKFSVVLIQYQRSQKYLEESVGRFEKEVSRPKLSEVISESAEKEPWSLMRWLRSLAK